MFAVPRQIFARDDVKPQDGILLWAQLDINATVRGDYLSTQEASLHLRKAVCAIWCVPSNSSHSRADFWLKGRGSCRLDTKTAYTGLVRESSVVGPQFPMVSGVRSVMSDPIEPLIASKDRSSWTRWGTFCFDFKRSTCLLCNSLIRLCVLFISLVGSAQHISAQRLCLAAPHLAAEGPVRGDTGNP